MEGIFQKIIILAAVYAVAVLFSGSGPSGSLVKMCCALCMLAFLFGIDVKTLGLMGNLGQDINIIKESRETGEEMFCQAVREETEKAVEEGVLKIAQKYGREIEAEAEAEIFEDKAEIVKITVWAKIDSVTAKGHMLNEIKTLFEDTEVEIIEK